MTLNNYEDVKRHFSTTEQHYVFISPTNFNVQGMELWVKNWKNLNLIDVFDGIGQHTLLPTSHQLPLFESVEDVNRFLLNQEAAIQYIKARKKSTHVNALFLFFSEELEAICRSLGIHMILPEHQLVRHVDNKITTTELGNRADVASVPNVISKIENFQDLQRLAAAHQLGKDWVIQKPYGDSGKTTYFVSSRADFDHIQEHISKEPVKIMKRINCVSAAIEGCATRKGTFVGPLLGELIGEPRLTPYAGGWCGNEYNGDLFTADVRHLAKVYTERLGRQLYQMGYRGYFEVDYLLDGDSGQLYLGEINPRLSGITALTNLSQFCQQHLPLLLLHLLEFSNQSFALDVNAYNDAAMLAGACEAAGQLVIKHLSPTLQLVASAPRSGVYKILERREKIQLELCKVTDNRLEATEPDEIFLYRILTPLEYAYLGADLAIVFTNFSFTEKGHQLSARTHTLIEAVRDLFQMRDLSQAEQSVIDRFRRTESQKSTY